VCGESRMHGSEGAGRGQPRPATRQPTTDSNLKSPPPWDTKLASNTNLNHCISTGSNERVSRRTIKGKITCFMIRSVPGTERQRGTATYRFSAIPDAGGLLKRLSAYLAAMSASNFFEPSLLTQTRYPIFS
jgi:hypothetical protein